MERFWLTFVCLALWNTNVTLYISSRVQSKLDCDVIFYTRKEYSFLFTTASLAWICPTIGAIHIILWCDITKLF